MSRALVTVYDGANPCDDCERSPRFEHAGRQSVQINKVTEELIKGITPMQNDPQAGETYGRVIWTSGTAVDADGASGQSMVGGVPIFAYAPHDKGADYLANAGYPDGAWHNVLIPVDGKPLAITVKGFTGYVSKTAYEWPQYAKTDARRFVDAAMVPYVVVNPFVRMRAAGVVLGCKARATWKGASVDMVVADVSGPGDIGEMSIAAAEALGIDADPRNGGLEAREIFWELFPGTAAVIGGIQYGLQRA